MAILDKFKEIVKKDKEDGIKIKANHVAITTDGIINWARNSKKENEEAYKQSNLIVKSTIKTQIKLKIPIITIYLVRSDIVNKDYFSIAVDNLIDLFNELINSELITKNRVKVSVFGKWYDLPGRAIEPIKGLLDSTKDYDHFFVNFCINYDGQEEIVDACKILAMQVKNEKIDLANVDKRHIKSNVYSSDFLPPDLVIKNGFKQKLTGLLLWDSMDSSLFFTNKLWPDFGKNDFEKAVFDFEKRKI